MEVQELKLKDGILVMLGKVHDVSSLKKVYDLLFTVLQSDAIGQSKTDDWEGDEDMPPELEEDLKLALEEMNDPKNFMSDEEARKMFSRWLK